MILHAVVFKKPYYNTKAKSLKEAKHMFPKEDIKTFVRETPESFRVRVVPKTQFINTTYRSKKLNPYITAVWGKLKN